VSGLGSANGVEASFAVVTPFVRHRFAEGIKMWLIWMWMIWGVGNMVYAFFLDGDSAYLRSMLGTVQIGVGWIVYEIRKRRM